jgi:hypothetical protein
MFGEAEASSFEYSAQGENVQQFLFVLAGSDRLVEREASIRIERRPDAGNLDIRRWRIHLRHHRLSEEEDEMLPVCQKRL